MRIQTLSSRRGVSQVRAALGAVVLGLVLGVLYLILAKRVEYFVVTSGSMEPTLMIGDRVIMSPVRHLERGEIVVFRKPDEASEPLVKRVVALPPDHVDVRGGRIYVDGVRMAPPHGREDGGPQPDRSWDLKPGQVFVAGDNRPISVDSRDYGPISKKSIRGIITYRVAPEDRRGVM